MSGKRQNNLDAWLSLKNPPPKRKVDRSMEPKDARPTGKEAEEVEETVSNAVEEMEDEAINTVEVAEQVEETLEAIDRVEDEQPVETTAGETREMPLPAGRKRAGAATYSCSFKPEWSSKWPFITRGSTSSYFWCSICRQENSCAHQGQRDVSRHIDSKGHQTKKQAVSSASSVAQFYSPTGSWSVLETQTRRAEVKVAVAMVAHNVPFAVADHFSPLYRECFKDSPTAQNYRSASTKTTCIVNRAMAPHFKEDLVMKMRQSPFTLITDGSNDSGIEKMNPLTVRIFDQKVVHRFLDMCPTSGRHCGRAEVIYAKIDSVLKDNAIPWSNCVGLSVDNAPVNTGVKNSIASRMLQENGSVFVHGCPCHILHNTAKQAGVSFLEVSRFDPEDFAVDVGYWFKGSTNRKGYLAEFCDLHGSDYMEILLHVSVRWLSLEACITRILRQYGPLASYFKSLNEKQPRFKRLVKAFTNPMTEVNLLFYQAIFPLFSTLNLLLQREKSSIFHLLRELKAFFMKLCARFMKPAALLGRKVMEIAYKDPLNHLPGEKLNVGFTTRATLNRLVEAGDVTNQEAQLFQQAALAFLVKAVEYAIARLPLQEVLLQHAQFVDVQQRTECGVEDVFYFVNRFQELLPFHDPKEQDMLSEEFMEYQLMDISMPENPITLDVEEFWEKMACTKNKVTGLNQFGRLAKVAKLVLVLPHSNADAERVFSMVGLNKTSTRNKLALEGTLSSIMMVKMSGVEPQCFKWEPETSIVKASKSATKSYNNDHL